MSLYLNIFKKTKSYKYIENYFKETFTEVLQTTLNPEGPGVIRIHLIPAKKEDFIENPCVALINGTDILPLNFVYAIILAELIREMNCFDGKILTLSLIDEIKLKTLDKARKILPVLPSSVLRRDMELIWNTCTEIAYRKPVTADVHFMSIGDYADCMSAPHRMDVMVSAMTKNGHWNCNQKCVHCYAAGQIHAEEEELTTEQWKEIIDKCRKACIPQITFTGGEPTMREDLFELISYSRWFISRLNTNGILLTKDYCENLRKAELDSVQITFYSHDPDIHNRLVGAKQYEHTLAGIENAVYAGLNVSINTPLCTLNRDYRKTLELLHEKGIAYVTCSGLITTGNAALEESEALQLSREEIKDVLKDAVDYCYSNDMELSFTSPGWVEDEFCASLGISTPSCGACLSNMAVTPNGNVVPCQSWLSEEPLGNILTDSWEDIWDSSVCRNIRAFAAQMSGKCPLRRYCR